MHIPANHGTVMNVYLGSDGSISMPRARLLQAIGLKC